MSLHVCTLQAEQGYYATREAEVAQDAYRRACAEAAEAVKAQLRRRAGKLQARVVQGAG